MDVKALFEKLSNPLWIGDLTGRVTLKPNTEGCFNIYWLLCGKPKIEDLTTAFFEGTSRQWNKARALSEYSVGSMPVEYTATVLDPKAFISWLETNKVDAVEGYGEAVRVKELKELV